MDEQLVRWLDEFVGTHTVEVIPCDGAVDQYLIQIATESHGYVIRAKPGYFLKAAALSWPEAERTPVLNNPNLIDTDWSEENWCRLVAAILAKESEG